MGNGGEGKTVWRGLSDATGNFRRNSGEKGWACWPSMKTLILTLCVLPALLGAIELPIPQKPTGPYEVCISAPSPDFNDGGYTMSFRERESQKVIGSTDLMGGYLKPKLAAESTEVLWHPSGEFVAFADRGTKHSKELYVYSLRGGKPVKLEYRDYIQNALGRVGAVEVGLHAISTPLSWEGDVLAVKFYFSVDHEGKGRHFYETVVKLRLSHGPNTEPSLGLLSVEKPKGQEG